MQKPIHALRNFLVTCSSAFLILGVTPFTCTGDFFVDKDAGEVVVVADGSIIEDSSTVDGSTSDSTVLDPLDATFVDTGVDANRPDVSVPPDASSKDATVDSSVQDATVQDASKDATLVDTGVIDTGIVDASKDVNVIDTGIADASKDVNVPDVGVPDSGVASGKWVTGYYVGYQQDMYPPSAIDFSGLTHLAVGRIVPNTNGTLTTNFDTHDGPAMAVTLSGLAHAAGKKAILMVGGSGTHAAWVSASSATNRPQFVANLKAAVATFGYDGLDLDWEPVSTSDQPLLTALVTDLRAAMPNAILTIPVDWSGSGAAYLKTLSGMVNQMNLMSYGMADAWPGWQSWHSSAITGDGSTTPSSVNRGITAYINAGVPAAKLGMGIGFYGSCWVGGVTGPNQSLATGSHVGASDNTMSYTNIMSQYFVAANYHWDAVAQVPYLGFTTPHGASSCTFVSYDDVDSILAKGAYARQKGIGGTIIWTIAQGYIPSGVGLAGKNPLLAATKQGFLD